LYRKPTDKVQYLLLSSCQPSHILKSIPYFHALRLIRIRSTKELPNKILNELKILLLSRINNKNIIDAAITKAKTLN
jgi:hypothetical protein